jgi:hypothetical protein
MPANARQINVTFETDVSGFQIFGPHGRVCATVAREIKANETVSVDCRDTMLVESETDVARRALTHPNRTALMASYVSPTGTMRWMPLGAHPQSYALSNVRVEYTFRNRSANEYWSSIASRIVLNREFPVNRAFERECARRGGVPRPVRESDKQFLRDTHGVNLGIRRCTHDWQCQLFARGNRDYTCVPDTSSVPSTQFANGDPNFVENVFGMEGGCFTDFANELMDPEFAGSRCVPGYDATWQSVLDYERAARAAVPNLTRALVNESEPWTFPRTKCTLPSLASSGRPTDACAGARGWLSRTYTETDSSLRVFEGDKIKSCARLRVNEVETWVAASEPLQFDELDLHTFHGPLGLVANVVRGVLYVNGEIWAQRGACDGATCDFGDARIACEFVTDDASFRVRTYLENRPVVTRRRDFWTSFLFI